MMSFYKPGEKIQNEKMKQAAIRSTYEIDKNEMRKCLICEQVSGMNKCFNKDR